MLSSGAAAGALAPSRKRNAPVDELVAPLAIALVVFLAVFLTSLDGLVSSMVS